jgi:hypothetical protein
MELIHTEKRAHESLGSSLETRHGITAGLHIIIAGSRTTQERQE